MKMQEARHRIAMGENAERIRRIVPVALRAERTWTVMLMADYMTEAAVPEDQVVPVFLAMAWAVEHQ